MCLRGTCDTVQFDGPWLKSEPTDANVPMNTSHVRERQILKTTKRLQVSPRGIDLFSVQMMNHLPTRLTGKNQQQQQQQRGWVFSALLFGSFLTFSRSKSLMACLDSTLLSFKGMQLKCSGKF